MEGYRRAVGERLKMFRQERGLTRYVIAKRGKIREDQVRAVEEGLTNYTIDAFIGYVRGSDLYIYFAEKDKKIEPHDFEDLISKGSENYPQ